MELIKKISLAVNPIVDDPTVEPMLEQFYYLLTARLADDELLARLSAQFYAIDNDDKLLKFIDNIWQITDKQLIVQQLAQAYLVDMGLAHDTIAKVTPFVYKQVTDYAQTQGMDTRVCIQNSFAQAATVLPEYSNQIIPATVLNGLITNNANAAGHSIRQTSSAIDDQLAFPADHKQISDHNVNNQDFNQSTNTTMPGHAQTPADSLTTQHIKPSASANINNRTNVNNHGHSSAHNPTANNPTANGMGSQNSQIDDAATLAILEAKALASNYGKPIDSNNNKKFLFIIPIVIISFIVWFGYSYVKVTKIQEKIDVASTTPIPVEPAANKAEKNTTATEKPTVQQPAQNTVVKNDTVATVAEAPVELNTETYVFKAEELNPPSDDDIDASLLEEVIIEK